MKYVTVKLSNAPALKREMVVHEEGEIMPTEHDQTMELYGLYGPHLAPLPLVPLPLAASSV